MEAWVLTLKVCKRDIQRSYKHTLNAMCSDVLNKESTMKKQKESTMKKQKENAMSVAISPTQLYIV